MTEETIFAVALDKHTPTERLAFLDEACGDDAGLRRRVEALIEAHERAADFLERPAVEQMAAGMPASKDPAATDAIQPAVDGIMRTPADALGGETQAAPRQGDENGHSLDFLAPSDKPEALGRVGHYHVLAVVGRGGMGVVLKAFDEELQRVVAIKVMASQVATTGTARKRFRREAQAAAADRDEHVITIHGVDEVSGLPYLVMEYVSGLSLQDRIDQGGPLEVKEILRIGMQTASGLAKAHAQGLIHRDIKPANILLENGVQRVKITDFGLARAVDDTSLTQSGVIAGTPQYMAPEQARGETVDHRADLFGLGSVLYAMCTGHPPFRASSTMAVLKRVCEDTPRPVREINPEIPDWLCAIIDKLQAKDPAERFQSAQELADLLGQHLAHLQQPALVPLPPRVERPTELRAIARSFRPRRYRRVLIVALLLLALGVAACCWFNPRLWGILTRSAIVEVDVFSEKFEDVNVSYRGVFIQSREGTIQINAGSWAYLSPGLYEFRPDGSWTGWSETLDKYEMVVSPPTLRLEAGQRYVVKLSLRRKPAPKPAAQVRPERNPVPGKSFVVGPRPGQPQRLFVTLNEAVQAAESGDTIEIRGDGPFVTPALDLKGRALTIRAGPGCRPTLRLEAQRARDTQPLFSSDSPLVLEGLVRERQVEGGGDPAHPERRALVVAWRAPLRLANCRLVGGQSCLGLGIDEVALCQVRNCEFLGPDLHAAIERKLPRGGPGRLGVENCTLLARYHGVVFHRQHALDKEVTIRLTHNTLAADMLVNYCCWAPVRDVLGPGAGPANRSIRVEATENVFDPTWQILDFRQVDQAKPLDRNETEPPSRSS